MPTFNVSEFKLHYFQSRFLQRQAYDQTLLCAMGKANYDHCPFCKIEVESLDILFWECICTGSFTLEHENRLLVKQVFFIRKTFCFGLGYWDVDIPTFLILHIDTTFMKVSEKAVTFK